SRDWAAAEIPTIARNAPYTTMSRNGRGGRTVEPNTVQCLAHTEVEGPSERRGRCTSTPWVEGTDGRSTERRRQPRETDASDRVGLAPPASSPACQLSGGVAGMSVARRSLLVDDRERVA